VGKRILEFVIRRFPDFMTHGCKKLGAHAARQSFNSEYLKDFPQT
jgi:hypothetical protein